uniref:Natural killer cells antigen CD94-like n=1 Tax=Geotrypetes seraphini TaxID=260995 RepID=A0A6P8PT14_GEOSA|nr:natural killer cells antigen CD94-like [Geotrypetes seraphini]
MRAPEPREEENSSTFPRPKETQQAFPQRCQSYPWFYASLSLSILCLLLLIVSITLGALYHTCLNNAELSLNQTRPDLLQKWEALRGQEYKFCPEEWRPWKGKCYFVSKETKNWNSSQQNCVSREAHLAMLKEPTDREFLPIGNKYWVGVNYLNDRWVWLDGMESRFPVMSYYNDPCGILISRHLFTWSCSNRIHWICEKPIVQLRFHQDPNLPGISVNGVKHIHIANEKVET